MLPPLSKLTFAALLREISLEGKPICTTTNGPDNNPFGYTWCIVNQEVSSGQVSPLCAGESLTVSQMFPGC